MIQKMVRDCRHNTINGQRLRIWYRRWSETVYMIQEIRDSNILQET
ncbi:unnamed protein product, partial [Staurois parvus]